MVVDVATCGVPRKVFIPPLNGALRELGFTEQQGAPFLLRSKLAEMVICL